MLDSVDLIAEHKQKYYDSLRACFTECEPIVSSREDGLAEYEGIDEEELDEEDKEIIQCLKSSISYYKIIIPLSKAWAIMYIEAIPLVIEEERMKYNPSIFRSEPQKKNYASRNDIYELLVGIYRPYQDQILDGIVCSPIVKDDLRDALSSENKQEFCSILKEKCDYSVVANLFFSSKQYLACLHGYDELISYKTKEILEKDTTDEKENLDKFCNWSLANDHRTLDDNVFKDLLNERERLYAKIEADNFDADDYQQLCSVEFVLIATLYENGKGGGFFPIEASILKPILESDEYIQLVHENKKQIDIHVQRLKEKERAEEQPKPEVVDEESTHLSPKRSKSSTNDDLHKEAPHISQHKKVRVSENVWYKSGLSEEEVKGRIQGNIWQSIQYFTEQLCYYHATRNNIVEVQDGSTSKSSSVKAFGAALIVFTAQKIGFAKQDELKISASMEDSIEFLARRNSVLPYLDILHNYFWPCYSNHQSSIPQEDKLRNKFEKKCKSAKPTHFKFIQKNYSKIGILYNNCQFLFSKAFGLHLNIYWVDWPEKADQAIYQASHGGEDLDTVNNNPKYADNSFLGYGE